MPVTVEEEFSAVGQAVIAGFSPIGVDVFNFPQRRVNNTYQIADQFTLRFGRHNLTLGTDNRRSELNSELPRNARPLVTFGGAPRLIFENSISRFPTSNDPDPIIRPIDLAAIGAPNNLFLTLSTSKDDSISLRFYQLNFYAQHDWRIRQNLSLSYGLRYEYNSPPRELHRRIESTFTDPALNLIPGLSEFIDGRTRINDPDRNNFGPRVSLAYSPNLFGNNRQSVFRAGYGLFYDQILGAVVSQSRNVFPTFLTLNFGGGIVTSRVNEFPLVAFNPARSALLMPDNSIVTLLLPGTLNRLNPALGLSNTIAFVNDNFANAILNTLEGIVITGDRNQPIRLTTDNTLSLLAPFGEDGRIGRNTFRAGNLLELDLAIIKSFKIDATRRFIFRTEIFNFINRTNFDVPVRFLEAPGFGKATKTVTPGRRIQFSLKFAF